MVGLSCPSLRSLKCHHVRSTLPLLDSLPKNFSKTDEVSNPIDADLVNTLIDDNQNQLQDGRCCLVRKV